MCLYHRMLKTSCYWGKVCPANCFSFVFLSPAYATPKLLDKVGMKISDIDVLEYHEAFAVSCAFHLINITRMVNFY